MTIELVALLALVGGQSSSLEAPEDFRLARVELVGPLHGLALGAPDAQSAWSGELGEGERFELGLAVATSNDGDAQPPVLTWDGAGAARFLGWDDELRAHRASEWTALPLELRTRPAVLAPRVSSSRVPLAAVALALAGALGVLAARARAGWALLTALLGAGLAGWAGSGASARRTPRVVEVDGASGEAVAVDAELHTLSGARLDDLRWEGPARAPMSVRTSRGAAELVLSSRGGWLRRWSKLERQGGALGPDVNEWGLLAPVWRRDPDGGWCELPAWPRGVVLGAGAGTPASEPPGWINPAAPAGAYVIVGRWADAPGVDSGRETWLRWIGR